MNVRRVAMIVTRARRIIRNIFKLLWNTIIVDVASVGSDNDATKLWHLRLGYLNKHGMMELYKRNILNGDRSCEMDLFKYCVLFKRLCVWFNNVKNKTKEILDYVHSDMRGPPNKFPREIQSILLLSQIIFLTRFRNIAWSKNLKVITKFKLWKAKVDN